MRFDLLARSVMVCTMFGSACLPEGAFKGAYSVHPLDLGDEWQLTADASRFSASRAVADAYLPLFSEDRYPAVVSMLVVRSGYLVAEGYFKTLSDARRPEHIMELTQVVTGLMIGVARQQGRLTNSQQTLVTLLPAAAQTAYAGVTIEQLLSMRAGVTCPDNWLQQALYDNVDSVDLILRQSRQSAPGDEWKLQGCTPHLVARVFERALGEQLAHATQRLLFDAIGVASSTWSAAEDGLPLGGVGLMLTPRDLARVGALVWRRGVTTSGAALMPAAWIDEATRAHARDVASPALGYGYFWYIDEARDAVLAEGQGGQYLYIDWRYDLVVALTSAPHANHAATLPRADFLRIIDTLTAAL